MKKHKNGIYTTNGEQKLLAVRAKVDGVLSMAYIKNEKVIAYASWEEISRQILTGPYLEITTKNND